MGEERLTSTEALGAEAKYASTVWGFEKQPYICVKPVNHPGVKPTKAIWRGTNAIESWSWENCNGNNAEVEVYSDAYSVELLINEKPIGKKKLNQFKAIFKTRYIEGKIIAIAFDESNKRSPFSALYRQQEKRRSK